MQGPQFIYFFGNDAGQFATYENGFLQWTGVARPLQFSPDMWQDLSILTERNKKYFGLDRTYGAPQGFVMDAAGILKSVFYKMPITTNVHLYIWEQKLYIDNDSYGYYYELLTKCEIDLSTFSHAGTTVTATILEGGIVKELKAKESVIYDIPLYVPNSVDVLMDGINLFSTATYKMADVRAPFVGGLPLPLIFLHKEGDQVNTLNQSQTFTDNTCFVENVKGDPVVHNIIGQIRVRQDVSLHFKIFLMRIPIGLAQTPPPIADALFTWDETAFTADPATNSMFLNITQSITLNAGQGLIFIGAHGPPFANPSQTMEFMPSDLTDSYKTRLSATLVKHLKPLDLFLALVAKIMGVTDGSVYADSTLLQNLDPFILFTSGDGLRQIVGNPALNQPGAFIKTSFTEFFAFMDMRYDAGIGIVNGKLRLESKQYWANNTTATVIQLGEASELDTSADTDYMFASLKIGYPNKLDNAALGDINGRFEFCMTHYYTSPNNRVTNELDLTCNYNAGMYVSENTRANTDGKVTTDGNSDNDTFVHNVLPTPTPGGPIVIHVPVIGDITFNSSSYYILDRTQNQYVSGLLDPPSAFNVRMSPKNCLLSKGAYLRSCLTSLDAGYIKFTSADKNIIMTTVIPSPLKIVDERGDVQIGKLDPPYFKAVKFVFTVPPPDSFALLNTIRKFAFTYNKGRVLLSGFDLKTGTQPADNRQQTFELLCAPDVDLSQLENVWE